MNELLDSRLSSSLGLLLRLDERCVLLLLDLGSLLLRLAAAAFFAFLLLSAGVGSTGAAGGGTDELDELASACLPAAFFLLALGVGTGSALGAGVGSEGGEGCVVVAAAAFFACFFFFVLADPLEDAADEPSVEGRGEVTFHNRYSAGGIRSADRAMDEIEVEDMAERRE